MPVKPESILHRPWLWAQGVMVLVMVVLAAPGRRESPQEAPAEPVPAAPLLAGAS
ncbi:hypothetical protein [Nonomuraea wenchangensis]|uniref:hypothetical protein n=1 Tax=Nonomuraea wenchangensis TaxID=568860 RepID=UPI003317F848